MESKKFQVIAIISMVLSVVMMVSIGGLVWMNVNLMQSNDKVTKYVDDQIKKEAERLATGGDDYVEDGYLVGGSYEIKSTKAISDAYISGDDSALTEEEKKTLELAKEVIDQVTTPEMSLYEKEIAIIDWICANVKIGDASGVVVPGLDSTSIVSTPYGVLSSKKSVCVGFATTFRMFMQMLGTECHVVHNDYHSWGLVKLEDEKWYHVDLYYENETHSYSYVNMTDSMCMETGHQWTGQNFLPEADGTEYVYANKNAETIKNINDIPAIVFEKAGGNHDSFVLFYKKSDNFNVAETNLLSMMAEMLNVAFYQAGGEYLSSKSAMVNWIHLGGETIVSLTIRDSFSSETPITEPDYTEEEYQAMINAINEAFGTTLNGNEQPVNPDYIEGLGYYVGNLDEFTYYIDYENMVLTGIRTVDGVKESVVYTDADAERILMQIYDNIVLREEIIAPEG